LQQTYFERIFSSFQSVIHEVMPSVFIKATENYTNPIPTGSDFCATSGY